MTRDWQIFYQPPNASLWQGRRDTDNGLRFHDIMRCHSLSNGLPQLNNDFDEKNTRSRQFALLGFACDEGVRRNQGRVGAAQGPNALRQALVNLTVHRNDMVVYDVGDIVCHDEALEEAQAVLGHVVKTLLDARITPVVLGGGHETAWGQYQGLAQTSYCDDLMICNFDAHFDLRQPSNPGFGTSGTPFWQIFQACQANKKPWRYFCFGIQPSANTAILFERAKKIGVQHLLAEDVHWSNASFCDEAIAQALQSAKNSYLTLCLDVFAASYAPGVSAPQAMGLTPAQVIPLLRHMASSGQVRTFDVVELAPPLDQDQRSARLAALLVSEFIHHCL